MKREYPSRPIVCVGVAVVDHGKLLLVKRGAKPSPGKWSFLGGVVELGEKVRDTVFRETKEETGLEVELIENSPLDVYDIICSDKNGRFQYHYAILQFLLRPKNGILQPTSDVTDARWVSFNEVEDYDLIPICSFFF